MREEEEVEEKKKQPAMDHQGNDYRVQMICPVIYLTREGVIRWEIVWSPGSALLRKLQEMGLTVEQLPFWDQVEGVGEIISSMKNNLFALQGWLLTK